MSTPDTEIEDILDRLDGCVVMERDVDLQYAILDHKKAEPIIHTLRTSRDTYWKERVRKEVEGMKHYMHIQFEGCSDIEESRKRTAFNVQYTQIRNETLDTLLDNLK